MQHSSTIRLLGCRQHNLRDLDLEFERGTLTVVVGPSGSGKRSLVFGTLHAESQRRFLQSCSLSERTRLESLTAPDLDSAENLLLTQTLKADSLATGPRNTVGTETGLLERLQRLFAEYALPRCSKCDLLVRSWSVEQIERELNRVAPGQRTMLGFPFSETIPLPDAIEWLNQAGFSRGVIKESQISFDRPLQHELSDATSAELLVIVDRVKAGGTDESRVRESLEICLRAGRGRCCVLIQAETLQSSTEIIDGTNWQRRDYFRDLTCPGCLREFPDPTFDLFRFTTSLGACPECHGRGSLREAVSKTLSTCPACNGTRWGEIPRLFEWNGHRLSDYSGMSIRELSDQFADSDTLSALDPESLILLEKLMRMKLGGLPLDLPSKQLSGSECRRIALARSAATSCNGRMFLLDDPLEGTSEAEQAPVLETIAELIARGGTLCAISDHPRLLEQADRIIELGPGSGEEGGTIIYHGPSTGWENETLADPASSSERAIKSDAENVLEIRNWNWPWTSSTSLTISLERLNVFAGSGETRPVGFVRAVLVPLLSSHNETGTETIKGRNQLREVIVLTASRRKSSPRQVVISALKAFGKIRELLAATEEARKRNYSSGYFSLYKADGGRCPQCQGVGRIDVDLDFLPELPMTCPTCRGNRYRETVDSVRFRGLSVVEILDQSVDEAFRFFRGHPSIQKKLQRLRRMHLGYLKLGQPLNQLSHGERRRVELASILAQTRAGGTLLILEEPSLGLSQSEVTELAHVLREYVVSGNTILAADHHPRMIAAADVLMALE